MTPRATSRQYAAQSMRLDGSRVQTFILDFRTSVNNLIIEKISPGQLYVFVLRQDATGNHRMTWGDTTRNAILFNPAPLSVTVQCFVGMRGGFMQAAIPGMWIEEEP